MERCSLFIRWYTYTTGTLGTAQQTIPYSYGDSNWKDKLTSYNGKTITYDAIGNPLNDGERTYTWGAGRQLRHISMPLTGVEYGFRVNHGIHADSNTKLCIVREDTKLKARLLRDGRDVTTECAASAFVWKKNGSAAGTGKEIAVTTAEINGDVQFSCTYSETQSVYGTVSVNNNLVASHTPATADANHTFSLVNGTLNVEVPNSAGNGTDYALENGVLSVNPGFTGSITAEYEFTTSPTREIDFKYDHNGLRTQKIVVENGVTTTYDYTLHGKLITHLTKRTVDENGEESTEELHFFYDAQSTPAFVEYDGAMYRYVHNLQGDIVAIVDTAGNPVVEYKYDAWGKSISTTGSLKTTLGEHNPFRYRGYVWDKGTQLYYLENRYYNAERNRFISSDSVAYMLSSTLLECNAYVYCSNNPLMLYDPIGAFSLKSLFKVAVATVVVAACVVASAVIVTTAASAFLPVAAATVAGKVAAVATGVSALGGAIDGAISANIDGGDPQNGAVAGSMGNAVGSVVSNLGYGPSPDRMHRSAIVGRATSSLIYDFTYDYLEQERVCIENVPYYIADATMDMTLSTASYGYSAGINNGIAKALVDCTIDGSVDVIQTTTIRDNRNRNASTTTRRLTARMQKDAFIYGL